MNFNKEYWSRVLSAHVILGIIDWVFDNPIYIAVIAMFGPLKGGLIMTIASMVYCVIAVIIYERKKIDWLGVNAVEAVKEHGASWIKRLDSRNVFIRIVAWVPSRLFLLVLWAIKKNDVLAFIALSVYEDPFKTLVFLRKGHFNGFGLKDLTVFIGSLLLSNIYWVAHNSVVIEISKLGWKQFNN